jgi:hypothetical protein
MWAAVTAEQPFAKSSPDRQSAGVDVMKSPLSGAVEAAVRSATMSDLATSSDPRPAAAALAGLYDALAHHLEPLVGRAGVLAIYGRSVHVATSEVPWIAAAANVRDTAGPVEALRRCLEHQDPSTAPDGARVLLVAFVDLLARLIGEGLTTRLAAQAWPRAFPDDAGQKVMR